MLIGQVVYERKLLTRSRHEFFANRAHETFVAGVRPAVALQICGLMECHAARVTDIWPLVCVPADVHTQDACKRWEIMYVSNISLAWRRMELPRFRAF